MSDITWKNETRRLRDLIPWEKNPRRMSAKKSEALRVSLERFGLAIPILISPNNEIYDGHQRQRVLSAMQEFGPNAIVDVRVSSRPLTEDERRELTARIGAIHAEWNKDDITLLYTPAELADFGFDEKEILTFFPFDTEEAEEAENNDSATDHTNAPPAHSSLPTAVISPTLADLVYSPKSPTPPPITQLYDDSLAAQVRQQIEALPINDDLRAFLLAAASRLIAFRFDAIAEFYAHADEEIRRIMRACNLVITRDSSRILHDFFALINKND